MVASDLDQVGEVLEHDKTALLVPPGDVDALAASLIALIEAPEKGKQLARAARERCVAEHSWRRHTERILDALAARS